MKIDFTLEITADNNFSILNRIINVLNRRRVRIKKLVALERQHDFTRGGAVMILFTTVDMMEKVKHQMEKLIEVEYANYYEGTTVFDSLTMEEKIVTRKVKSFIQVNTI